MGILYACMSAMTANFLPGPKSRGIFEPAGTGIPPGDDADSQAKPAVDARHSDPA